MDKEIMKPVFPGAQYWIESQTLRRFSLSARGLLVHILAFVAKSGSQSGVDEDPFIVLRTKGEAIDRRWLARIVGVDLQDLNSPMSELLAANVLSEANNVVGLSVDYINANAKNKASANSTNYSQDDMSCAEFIFGRIRYTKPDFRAPNLERWARDVRLLHLVDGKSYSEITILFKWASQDRFWHKNILSPAKLRKQWDVLVAQMRDAKPEPVTLKRGAASAVSIHDRRATH